MRRALVVFWIWAFLAALMIQFARQPDDYPGKNQLIGGLPGQISVWEATATASFNTNHRFTPGFSEVKQSFFTVYRSNAGFDARVEMVYCPDRKPRNLLSVFHQRLICKTGLFANALTEEISLQSHKAIRMRFFDGNQTWRLVFWLQSWEKSFSQPFDLVCWQYWQQFRGLRSDGCFILAAVQEPLTPSQEIELSVFLAELYVHVQNRLKSTLQKG